MAGGKNKLVIFSPVLMLRMDHPDLSQAYSGGPAWKRLITSPLTSDARITLITHIFSDNDETEAAKGLCGDDAQTFVDVVEEVIHFLSRMGSVTHTWTSSSCRVDIG